MPATAQGVPMNARFAEGRRIVKVNQTRFWNEHLARHEWAVTSLDLDNGTSLLLMSVETEAEPVVNVVIWKPDRLTAPDTT